MLRRLAAAVPDLAIAVAFILVVVDPLARESPAGTVLWRGAVMEFFAIHAAGFLMVPWIIPGWSRGRRVLFVALLSGGYSLVLGIASLVIQSWWPLLIFWGLTANRVFDTALREVPDGRQLMEEALPWAGNLALFMIAAIITGMLGGGRQVVLTAAAFYFAANAVSELGGWWWVRRWLDGR